MSILPVILSGGSGTRLWPLSREHYPKQLLALVGDRSLLQDTLLRLDGLVGVEAPIFVCNEEHRFLVAEQTRQIGKKSKSIILEPTGRNTAPALTIAALALEADGNDEPMLVMPADHIIQDNAAFQRSISEAAELARNGKLVTFGIVPSKPETGYGYIHIGDHGAVTAFIEKPDESTAVEYLNSGNYLWNSGMFMMRPSIWIKEIENHRPDILASCRSAYTRGVIDTDFFRIERESFLSCPKDSIDYAVMEKTENAVYVPLNAGWSDIGAWSALWSVIEHDEAGNVIQGDVLVKDTTNALLIARSRLLAAVGLNDIIAVETPDAVLIAHRNAAQEVKAIVKEIEASGRSEHQSHIRVYRPWGYYETVDVGKRFQVKRLQVNPGESLSLQLHHQRAEHWVVVQGTARVTRGEDVFDLSENQSTYIPVGTKHRLENSGSTPLEIIEVQSGAYLGEDDIVRFDDIYNRHKN